MWEIGHILEIKNLTFKRNTLFLVKTLFSNLNEQNKSKASLKNPFRR